MLFRFKVTHMINHIKYFLHVMFVDDDQLTGASWWDESICRSETNLWSSNSSTRVCLFLKV